MMLPSRAACSSAPGRVSDHLRSCSPVPCPAQEVVPGRTVPAGTAFLFSPRCIQPTNTCCLQTLHRDPSHVSGKGMRWEYTSRERQSCPAAGPARCPALLPHAGYIGDLGSGEEQIHSGSMTASARKAVVIFFASARHISFRHRVQVFV